MRCRYGRQLLERRTTPGVPDDLTEPLLQSRRVFKSRSRIFDTYGVINCGSTGLEEGIVNQCLEFGEHTRSKPWLLTHFTKMMMMKCCFTVYVHRNRRLIRDGSPGRPPRLTFTQLLSSVSSKAANMVLRVTSTETIRLIRDGEKGMWRWG